MSLPNFDFENAHDGPVCGIDEVGRGPLAGPVVAAAVILKPEASHSHALKGINDSKKLTANKRRQLCALIRDFGVIGIGAASVEEIDRHNIYHATFIAMRRAFDDVCLQGARPVMALIDGNKAPEIDCRTQTIIKGDQKSVSIAAASIIAKEYRDALMCGLATRHPGYGWERNAGYGTKEHLAALKIRGATDHHRKSFKPIYELFSISC